MSDVSAEEALERAKAIASRLTGGGSAPTADSSANSGGTSHPTSRKRSRWGISASDPPANPTQAAQAVAAAIASGVETKKAKTTADAAQRRLWISISRERPAKHYRLFFQDKLESVIPPHHKEDIQVELQGRGSSDQPAPPGVPEQPLHMVISGPKAHLESVETALEELLHQADNMEPLVPPEDPETAADTSRALTVVGESSGGVYRPASVAQMIGQANLPASDAPWIHEDVLVPNGVVGFIIGRGGENITSMQSRTGTKVQIQKEHELQPGQTQRTITLSAQSQASIDECRSLIENMVKEKATLLGGNSKDERLLQQAVQAGHQLVTVQVPDADVGLVIGKSGATIKAIQDQTGASIQVPPSSENNASQERTIRITHPQMAGAEAAKQRILDLLKSMPSYGNSGDKQVTVQISIPDKDVGLCIGRQGCVIREMQTKSNTRIQIPSHPTPGEMPRVATVTGTKEGCDMVQQMVNAIVEAQSSVPVMSGTYQNYGNGGAGGQSQDPYSAEWAAYHAAQAAAQQQSYAAAPPQQQQQVYQDPAYYGGGQYPQQHQQQQSYAAPASAYVAAPAPAPQQSDAYHEQFFRYWYYYGEEAARAHYTVWAPPPGTPNPYGANPNGVQPAPAAKPAPAPAPPPPPSTTNVRDSGRRNVSNLPAWMTKG